MVESSAPECYETPKRRYLFIVFRLCHSPCSIADISTLQGKMSSFNVNVNELASNARSALERARLALTNLGSE